ncbi:hypothetical protein BDF21DRAFT_409014 [Thamnidium elegans]|nr:hypothetical protein BDF21DRAFT_409014 [Thamnidium elegans]
MYKGLSYRTINFDSRIFYVCYFRAFFFAYIITGTKYSYRYNRNVLKGLQFGCMCIPYYILPLYIYRIDAFISMSMSFF